MMNPTDNSVLSTFSPCSITLMCARIQQSGQCLLDQASISMIETGVCGNGVTEEGIRDSFIFKAKNAIAVLHVPRIDVATEQLAASLPDRPVTIYRTNAVPIVSRELQEPCVVPQLIFVPPTVLATVYLELVLPPLFSPTDNLVQSRIVKKSLVLRVLPVSVPLGKCNVKIWLLEASLRL